MVYDLVIIGATFAGLGAALTCQGEMLVLERRPQIGYEFLGAYCPDTAWRMNAPTTKKGEELRDDLLKSGILSGDGTLYMPEVLPFLYHRVWQERLPILLMAEIVKVERLKDEYEIQIYAAEGIRYIRAKQVLDTTEGLSLKPELRPHILKKSINALLLDAKGGENLPKVEGLQILSANKKGEAVLRLELEKEDHYIQARLKLHNCWESREEQLSSWTLTVMADCFGIVLDRSNFGETEGHTLLCSACFANPLEAFETGVKFLEGSKAYVAV